MAFYILTERAHREVCEKLDQAQRWDRLRSHRGFEVSLNRASIQIRGAHLDGVHAAKVTFHQNAGDIHIYETRVLNWQVKLGGFLTLAMVLLGGFGLFGGFLQTAPIAVLLGALSMISWRSTKRDEQVAAEWFALQVGGALYRSTRRLPIQIPNPFREMTVAYQKVDRAPHPEGRKPQKKVHPRIGPMLRL